MSAAIRCQCWTQRARTGPNWSELAGINHRRAGSARGMRAWTRTGPGRGLQRALRGSGLGTAARGHGQGQRGRGQPGVTAPSCKAPTSPDARPGTAASPQLCRTPGTPRVLLLFPNSSRGAQPTARLRAGTGDNRGAGERHPESRKIPLVFVSSGTWGCARQHPPNGAPQDPAQRSLGIVAGSGQGCHPPRRVPRRGSCGGRRGRGWGGVPAPPVPCRELSSAGQRA